MRTILKAQLPADPASSVPTSARFQIMRSVIDNLKPEAAYFYPENGRRTALIVFDLKTPSDLPSISEPLFRQGATVEFSPVMTLEDLQAGMRKLEVEVTA